MTARLLLVALALLLGCSVATQLQAWEFGYHSSLGSGLPVGVHRLYPPYQGVVWAWRWYGQAPQRFQAALVMGMGTAGGVVLLGISRQRRQLPRTQTTLYGASRWMRGRELWRAGLCGEAGLYLGMYKGQYLRHDGEEHMLVVAPSRSRKTASLVVPNLLTWPGPAFVYDPKGELWQMTAGYRSQVQPCYYFNPLVTATHRWNPLDMVRVGTDYAIRDVLQLAEILVMTQGHTQDGRTDGVHWNEKARKMLAGGSLHLLHAQDAALPPTLAGVAHLFSLPFASICEDMAESPDPFVAACGRDGLDIRGEEASSVQSTVRRVLDPFLEPLIAQATNASDFDIRRMREAAGQTLYLSTPLSDRQRLRPLLRLMIESFCTAWTETLPAAVGPTARILVALDEFPSLGRLPVISENLDFMAGYGLRCLLISPTLTRLEEVYGRDNALWAQCHIRVTFAPNEYREAEKIVHELGRETVEVTSETHPTQHRVGQPSQRASISRHPVGRPLLHMDEVKRLPLHKSLVFIGREAPICATKINLHQRGWQRLLLPPPVVSVGGSHDA